MRWRAVVDICDRYLIKETPASNNNRAREINATVSAIGQLYQSRDCHFWTSMKFCQKVHTNVPTRKLRYQAKFGYNRWKASKYKARMQVQGNQSYCPPLEI